MNIESSKLDFIKLISIFVTVLDNERILLYNKFHIWLSNIGIDPSSKFAEKRKIKLVNIGTLVSIPWIIMPSVRLVLGFNWHACVIDFLVAIGSVSALWFNYKHKHQFARFVLSFSNYAGLVAMSLLYGRFMGTHVVLFAWLICNLYFFDNKRIIALITAQIGVTMAALEYYFTYHGAMYPDGRITIEYFAILVSITFFVIYAITTMYKNDSMLYSTAIEENNESLEQLNEEIIIQNEALNYQKDCIDKQKQNIESSFNSTRDSIRYALNIQRAILKTESNVQQSLRDSFIIYRPKDIVSGDFYWINKIGDISVVVVVDCTGHGVPGAFMTIVANSLLNEIVLTNRITDPATILFELDKKLLTTFQINTDGVGISTIRDGMDVAVCCIDGSNLHFAGAKRPLYYTSNGQLFEEKGSRHAVGATSQSSKDFETRSISMHSGMIFYLFSDGVTDQFNDTNNKRYSSRKFRDLLVSIANLAVANQKTEILRSLYLWQGETPQTDDIVVVAFRAGV